MNKGKIKAALFIIVFILIIAVILSWLTGEERDTSETVPAAQITPTMEQTDEPVATAAPEPAVGETPVPTPEPTPEATPDPTPILTPEPEITPTPEPVATATPEPVPQGTLLGSGTFSSDTGTSLNTRAVWEVYTINDDQVEIVISFLLDSYGLHLKEAYGAVNLAVDGEFRSFNGPALDYDGKTLLTTTLAHQSFTVNIANGETKDVTVACEWQFGGSYSGTNLPVVECGGTISIVR